MSGMHEVKHLIEGIFFAAAGGVLLFESVSGAAGGGATLASSVCADLHSQKPTISAPLKVECRWPGERTEFICPGNADEAPIPAETADPACAHPNATGYTK